MVRGFSCEFGFHCYSSYLNLNSYSFPIPVLILCSYDSNWKFIGLSFSSLVYGRHTYPPTFIIGSVLCIFGPCFIKVLSFPHFFQTELCNVLLHTFELVHSSLVFSWFLIIVTVLFFSCFTWLVSAWLWVDSLSLIIRLSLPVSTICVHSWLALWVYKQFTLPLYLHCVMPVSFPWICSHDGVLHCLDFLLLT